MPKSTILNTRRCKRKPKSMPVSLVLRGERLKSDPSAFTQNISLSGANVRTKLPLAPGEWVGVIPPGNLAYPIPARTVWVREDECMWTHAGLEFLDASEA